VLPTPPTDVLRLVHRGIPDPTWFDYLGGAMNVIRRIAVAAVVAAGLFVSMSGPAAADVIVAGVAPHRHCLLTPKGWVPIAGGVSVKADEQDAPALDQFHGKVHRGKPTSTGGLIIVRVDTEDKVCATARIP
jgi:hypothetical protein